MFELIYQSFIVLLHFYYFVLRTTGKKDIDRALQNKCSGNKKYGSETGIIVYSKTVVNIY